MLRLDLFNDKVYIFHIFPSAFFTHSVQTDKDWFGQNQYLPKFKFDKCVQGASKKRPLAELSFGKYCCWCFGHLWKSSESHLAEFTLLMMPSANKSCAYISLIARRLVAPGNRTAKSASSPGTKSLVPRRLWNSMARNDRWGWSNWGLVGIFSL